MNPIRIIRWETLGFLWLLSALLVYRMLTREISLNGLLRDETDGRHVSVERVQLLISTIAVSLKIVQGTVHSNGAMPEITPQWLGFFGASGGVYGLVKGLRAFRSRRAQQALQTIGRL